MYFCLNKKVIFLAEIILFLGALFDIIYLFFGVKILFVKMPAGARRRSHSYAVFLFFFLEQPFNSLIFAHFQQSHECHEHANAFDESFDEFIHARSIQYVGTIRPRLPTECAHGARQSTCR